MNDEQKKNPFDAAYQVALYQHTRHGWISVMTFYGAEDSQYHSGYMRISEPTDVRFVGLKNDDVVRNAIEALDAEEREARRELNQKLFEIQERRSTLLALTHQPAAELMRAL
jgi:hypothetical protein